MKSEYFIVDFRSNTNHTFCLYTFPENSEKDIFASNDKKILTFENLDAIISYVNSNNLNLIGNSEDSVYDVKKLQTLLSHLDPDFNCREVLNFWNITDTICNTILLAFIGNNKKYDDIYNKLFGGCNTVLNAYEYHPKWKRKELKKIQKVLRECFLLINKYIL